MNTFFMRPYVRLGCLGFKVEANMGRVGGMTTFINAVLGEKQIFAWNLDQLLRTGRLKQEISEYF